MISLDVKPHVSCLLTAVSEDRKEFDGKWRLAGDKGREGEITCCVWLIVGLCLELVIMQVWLISGGALQLPRNSSLGLLAVGKFRFPLFLVLFPFPPFSLPSSVVFSWKWMPNPVQQAPTKGPGILGRVSVSVWSERAHVGILWEKVSKTTFHLSCAIRGLLEPTVFNTSSYTSQVG